MKKTRKTKLGRLAVPVSKEFKQNSPIFIPLFFADPTQKRQIVWELQLENGQCDSGRVSRNAINLPSLPIGIHHLTVIVGQNLLSKGHKIYECSLHISE
ncbi:hypothetical protein HT665_03775 [Ursidibacter maritimus]|uniref:Uncharacterized protein n=1 Tax=Ursidibacter maritimus TaxID=1331689 RepID=A0A949T443_9PAST|nr:hypothetical protein [Ursidibacter maritimus]KAE9541424.1 hypothetical protein A1D26_00500 [Ursidibacter maritimus]MBV6523856.1 hypothetical protein [Ursidibacter maritimus]MBV6526131.1 hypothetical protein [Ursidibacter maritimus]MBV6527171.1 hypothetical protein [Ursidibacter maritimus]MBV6528994.1 hypothetical protein [Ursidibacter maritimus]